MAQRHYLKPPWWQPGDRQPAGAARRGRLARRDRVEQFAVEIPAEERRPLIETYLHRFGRMPKVATSFQRLPDPADHPTFRITPIS